MKRLSIIAAAVLLSTAAFAQVPSTQPPYNIDTGALITLTAHGAGTVNSATQTNLDKVAVSCVFQQTSHTGSPSSTFSIQTYDAGTASWFTKATSAAVTADSTPTVLEMGAGAQTSSLLSNMTAYGARLSRVWRVSITVGGTSTPVVTGKIGCNVLK